MMEQRVKPNKARIVAIVRDIDPVELGITVNELRDRIVEVGEVESIGFFEEAVVSERRV